MKFDKTRMAIVDRVGSNLLVRGCVPIDDNGKFAYQGIMEVLSGSYTPEAFVTISLMDNTGERDSWQVDFSGYSVDPDLFPKTVWPPYVHIPNWDPKKGYGTKLQFNAGSIPGSLYWWPIEGMFGSENADTYLKAPGWDFSGCVELLKKLCAECKNTLIYFHCMLGADRTGAMHAGYLISKGINLEDALSTCQNSTSAGSPSFPYVNLVTEYSKIYHVLASQETMKQRLSVLEKAQDIAREQIIGV